MYRIGENSSVSVNGRRARSNDNKLNKQTSVTLSTMAPQARIVNKSQ